MRTLLLVVETMRPRQWSKNGFVLGGLVFSGSALQLAPEVRAWTTFVAFCLMSGAAYLLNDAFDEEADRLNPRTAGRPIARGDLPARTALVAAGVAAALALGLAAVVNWKTLLTLTAFMVLQFAYSNWLKHVLFVDVMTISAGFVLRAFAGLVCIPVVISPWLLLCTGLLALFLGLAKRRAEAVSLGGTAHPQRPVLEGYSVALLDELIGVVTPSILVAYALYTVLGSKSGDAMLLTVPFVLYGIFRVLWLIHHRSATTEEPAVVVWRDKPLLVCIVLWGLTAGIVSVVAGTG
ncbi:MAG TPA: UbiA family prenyltransferase [Solirubrobacteraceae bacterium]|nr:UbiA family prenyltransferase [Solirubrobacteraceae bacterium]